MHAGNFSCFYHLLTFFYVTFSKILSEPLSESQTVWIQIRTDFLSVLIWVQTVCKSYQQTSSCRFQVKRQEIQIWKCAAYLITINKFKFKCQLENKSEKLSYSAEFRIFLWKVSLNIPSSCELDKQSVNTYCQQTIPISFLGMNYQTKSTTKLSSLFLVQ